MHTIESISAYLKAEFVGDGSVEIKHINNLELADTGQISFFHDPKLGKYFLTTNASAVLVKKNAKFKSVPEAVLIGVDDVQKSFRSLLELFGSNDIFDEGIEKHVHISANCLIHPSVSIGNFTHVSDNVLIEADSLIGTQVFIGNGVKIGKRVKIYPGVKIYKECVIGDDCIIHSNVVLGSDGFGYNVNGSGSFDKIPQIGNVVLESNVEIGANTVIDRSTFGSTIIKKGVKLDNLIQVGHNVEIGENSVLAAQTGIAGSVKLGSNCVVGGQSAFVPHIKIANGSQFQGQSGVGQSIHKPGGRYFGSPAIDFRDYIRSYSVFKILPALEMKIKTLEKELDALKNK
jgi:UDP-3-O-[3-hydroxymyristoyl] glucosamine N-acyltransferase